ncbi:hypothetical protein GALMADRAFT_135165 [Galerina marginata CBS 339.88]|uniref:DUF8205 domain-containing protein n=1 Tax=Galerina marginata (strain CBS 339.88) TaxID=685588 RepID=A0A067TEV2_GALM3|nr:hypothetical protein GALMADRAFT_135165 [Galerina marginata CBS 339.88]
MSSFKLPASAVPIEEFGPNPREIKHQRRENRLRLTCQYCRKPEEPGHRHKSCAKCKVLYCSREKIDWPRHKVRCMGALNGLFPDFNKICQNLLANDTLLSQLHILIAHELDLANTPYFGKRFNVQIFIHFEPLHDSDFLKVIDPKFKIDDTPMRGMLQIGGITSANFLEGKDGITMLPSPTDVGRTCTPLLVDAQDPLPFVCVQFVRILPSGSCQFMTTGLVIPLESIQQYRIGKIVHLPLRARGVFYEVPASATAYRDFINEHIRLNTDNRWLLQMDMLQKDKELCRDSGASNPNLPDSLARLIRDTGMRRLWAIYTPGKAGTVYQVNSPIERDGQHPALL